MLRLLVLAFIKENQFLLNIFGLVYTFYILYGTDIYRIITHTYSRMLYYNKNKKDIEVLKRIINELFSLNDTICTDFIEKEHKIFFDYYVLYLQKNYKQHEKLLKKIEDISYESAYNFIVKSLKMLS